MLQRNIRNYTRIKSEIFNTNKRFALPLHNNRMFQIRMAEAWKHLYSKIKILLFVSFIIMMTLILVALF